MRFFAHTALAVADGGAPAGRRWPRAAAAAGVLLALVAWVPRTLAEGSPARAATLFPGESEPREDLASRAMAAVLDSWNGIPSRT